jgi:hypothetical protein
LPFDTSEVLCFFGQSPGKNYITGRRIVKDTVGKGVSGALKYFVATEKCITLEKVASRHCCAGNWGNGRFRRSFWSANDFSHRMEKGCG